MGFFYLSLKLFLAAYLATVFNGDILDTKLFEKVLFGFVNVLLFDKLINLIAFLLLRLDYDLSVFFELSQSEGEFT